MPLSAHSPTFSSQMSRSSFMAAATDTMAAMGVEADRPIGAELRELAATNLVTYRNGDKQGVQTTNKHPIKGITK